MSNHNMYILYLVPTSNDAHTLYTRSANSYMEKPYDERDAGFDLYCEERSLTELTCGEKISQNVVAAVYDTERKIYRAYMMLPRSSISKTSMRLANSVGLIDAGYRGPIMAPVDTTTAERIRFGDRYFQLTAPDLLPFDSIEIVKEIPGGPTVRGTGGFGSTGR